MREELTYVKNLKTLYEMLKTYKQETTRKDLLTIFDSCIASAKAIILLYKNLGECWNELTAYIIAEKNRLESFKAEFENFKGEINSKIDEVNNYLNSEIKELDTRLHDLEETVEDLSNDIDALEDGMQELDTSLQNLGISVTDLSGRMTNVETLTGALDETIEEAKPYQFQITLPTSGWSTYGTDVYISIQTTFDLSKPAMVTLTAGGNLTDYDDVFDNLERAKAIDLFGCFDDDGGDPTLSCLQFYASSVPSSPLKVLVTISPYLSTSTASSTVVNGIY